ncbi:PLP-dependent aspartate aminotransferase family protein [Inquilinus sp. CAU 1745]|uniref:trans-sulfuration enzyme family protein n=1 Tax=Inquilinus sp. CAU 1745 TaxID=3140369 RepID=UPI00325B0A9C
MAEHRPETLAARADGYVCRETGAVTPPIHPSSTYARDEQYEKIGGHRGYSRDDNPTYDVAEQLLAKLEGGAAAKLFASGMAAIASVFQALSPGDHVVVGRDMYFGTSKYLREIAIPWGLEIEFVDTADLEAVERVVRPGATKLVYIETPANPTWKITDIAAVAAIAHAAGAALAADSTTASPVITRPIEHGADLVIHSATKYLNGHSDVLAGAVVAAREDALWERIGKCRFLAGGILGPFEAWLLLRGMRTLYVRVRHASDSAMRIARHFEGHKAVAQVCYPGLPEFPGHDIAARQMTGGFGGMLSLRLAGGGEAAVAMIRKVKLFVRATSLGGVESLIEHRATIEGEDSDVPADLLRLSVGLEAVEDLIADLEQAL